jgi:2-amino-4-hydroxy-6-hydroxymethyldihydropteridine diphosphokinase
VAGLRLPPALAPEVLLENLLMLETTYGRAPKKIPNEPRPLDLDLLAVGAQIRATEKLILPHPRAHCRRFVLLP